MAVVDRDEQPACSPIGRARHYYAVVVLAGADRIVGAVEEFERHQIHIVAVGGVAFDVEKRIVKHKGNGGQTRPLPFGASQEALAAHILEGVEAIVRDARHLEEVEQGVVFEHVGKGQRRIERPAGAHRVFVERRPRQLSGNARAPDVKSVFGRSCVFTK